MSSTYPSATRRTNRFEPLARRGISIPKAPATMNRYRIKSAGAIVSASAVTAERFSNPRKTTEAAAKSALTTTPKIQPHF